MDAYRRACLRRALTVTVLVIGLTTLSCMLLLRARPLELAMLVATTSVNACLPVAVLYLRRRDLRGRGDALRIIRRTVFNGKTLIQLIASALLIPLVCLFLAMPSRLPVVYYSAAVLFLFLASECLIVLGGAATTATRDRGE